MTNVKPYSIKTISEFHRFRNLPKPEHPLISIINMERIQRLPHNEPESLILDFYSISLKKGASSKIRYGQQQYDFDEGVMFFIAPNQVFGIGPYESETANTTTGWMLLVHPDFLWNTALAKHIKQYEYFDYSVNEALFLSDKEETIVNSIVENINGEYQSNIDQFSKQIIVSHLENLLCYAERFYNRQFITREKTNHHILDQLETLLSNYFSSDDLATKGLPSVQYISGKLNLSPTYLRSLLKTLTGQNTQQHIHDKLIEKAKEKLATTNLSISEIAYELGFEHLQSFSKLFKTKTNVSPLVFRKSFN
jgi:AraC-like DNA-binding protein